MQVLKQNKLLGKRPMQFADCVAKSGRTGRARRKAVRKKRAQAWREASALGCPHSMSMTKHIGKGSAIKPACISCIWRRISGEQLPFIHFTTSGMQYIVVPED